MNITVEIGKLKLKNPILTASGTFGYGQEFEDFFDPSILGAIITKGTTLEPREGNNYPRMAETSAGMLNAVGLQNKGVHYFIDEILPAITKYQTNIIVNVAGNAVEDYVEAVSILDNIDRVDAVELNVSCPNVKHGGMQFGTNYDLLKELLQKVRKTYNKTLIVKLSPNVTKIEDFALLCQYEQADAITVANTYLGMAIDINTMKPKLATITGGLSGPAIKPITLRMVYQCAQVVNIPIIASGGIISWQDAIEYFLAGATAIQIGTANFINPSISQDILGGIEQYLLQKNIKNIKEIIGAMKSN
ncbi:MAG TPA: dihydroorotate dehydrogenase [Bacteroidales bacterium]|nr:dihydroorotate dehydrogenase [Bacteroidales bacterium]